MILLESIDRKVQITLGSVSRLDSKIDSVKMELKEDMAVLDCNIMGLSKRVDSVEQNFSYRIDGVDKKVDAVYKELVSHRNDTGLHRSQPKRPLKRVV